MCDCFDRILKEIKPRLKPKQEVIEFKINWKGQVMRFDGGCGIGLYVETEFRHVKTDGTPYKNLTKKENFIALSYCPFCGESLEKDKLS